jgi:WD40 repeat protein
MTPTVAAATANPFVGPHALTETDSLFGRSVELRTLHDLLIAERIVLLYSPSGAGKTSLLHAGLKRLLVQDGLVVRPTIRVAHEMPPALGDLSARNRYVLSTLLSLEAGRQNEPESAPLAARRVDEYLANTRRTSRADAAECLFFDQFEELFTVDPIDLEDKRRFLEEVGQVLRDRGRWAVFSVREDFLAHLDPYLNLIPTKLRTRFRLDLLRPEPAKQAIQGPAREAGVEFSADAAWLVVDDLRTVLVQRGGAAVPAKGPTVEPVQLQVVCHRLWTRLGEATRVEPEDARELGDVDNALRDFYDDVVREVAQSAGVTERALRTWISDELVTEQGYRAQVQRGPADDAEGRVLPALENAHLVRADSRRGTVWYELAHDRLVDPVRSSNAAWLEEHLNDVQRGARLWHAQRRGDGALLVGPQLKAAEAWAAQHSNELNDLEREFLVASHKEEAARERRLRITRRWLAAVALVAVLALVAAALAYDQSRRANQAAKETKAGELAAVADQLADQSLDRALLLAVEAYRQHPGPEVTASLLTTLARVPALEQILRGHDEEVRAVAISDDGSMLASASRDDTVVVWDRSGTFERRLDGHGGEVHGLAFSPDGATLVSGSEDGKLRLWDPASGESIGEPLTGHTGEVRGIAIDPDGRWLASASHDRTVRLWDLKTAEPRATLRDHDDLALDVAFNANGTLLASAGADGAVVVRRTDDLVKVGELDLGDPARAIEFHPADPHVVAAGSNDGTVALWDVRRHTPSSRLMGHNERVFDVAFSPNGQRVASASRDQTVVVHDVATGNEVQRLDAHAGDVRSVAFWPDGDRLASGSRDGTVMLWDLKRSQRLAQTLPVDGPAAAVAFRPDGHRVAIMSEDGVLTVVDPSAESGPQSRRVSGARGPASVKYTHDGEAIATGTADGQVGLWAAGTLTARWQVAEGHRGGVRAIAVDEDGELVASGGEDSQLALWDAQSGRSLARLDLEYAVVDITFGPDAKTIIATDANGTLWGWQRDGDRWERQHLADNQVRSLHLALGAHDSRLVDGTSQDQVVMWSLEDGLPNRPVAQLDHDGAVTAIAAGADRIAAASAERDTVTLWQLDSGRPLGTLPITSPAAVALDPTGLSLVVAGGTGTELWDLRIDRLLREACVVASRNLTGEEWRFYVGGAYRETCPDAGSGVKPR